jgi:hypothetical protein
MTSTYVAGSMSRAESRRRHLATTAAPKTSIDGNTEADTSPRATPARAIAFARSPFISWYRIFCNRVVPMNGPIVLWTTIHSKPHAG